MRGPAGAERSYPPRPPELFPVQMEGVKLTVNKGLSNHFQVRLRRGGGPWGN